MVEKLLLAYPRDPDLFPASDESVVDNAPITDDLGDYYEEEHEVERLLAHRFDPNGKLQYRVRWYGFTKEHDTWQIPDDIASAPDELQKYQKTLNRVARTKRDAALKAMDPDNIV